LVRIVQSDSSLHSAVLEEQMVRAALVPLGMAPLLGPLVDRLAEGLERGDLTDLKPIPLLSRVIPAEIAVRIALADVAHCFQLGQAGYQLPACRWESLAHQLEQLAALSLCGEVPDAHPHAD
jgi:hypothetical protein